MSWVAGLAAVRIPPAVPRIVPFLAYIGFLALSPVAAPLLHDGRWWYALQAGAAGVALCVFSREYVELSSAQARPDATTLVWAIGLGIAVFVAWINLDVPFLSIGDPVGFDPHHADGGLDWSLVAMRILGAAFVVPVMEELFWRSLVMRWLERSDFMSVIPAMIGIRAVALSSIVFGLEHGLWFAGVLAGLAYAWLYRRSGNLWASIIAHGVTNLLLGLWVVATGNWQFW